MHEAARKKRKASKRLAKAKKDKRIRDDANAAETAEAEVAAIAAEAAAEVAARNAANALAAARTPTAPTPAACVPDNFLSEPMSMAANLLIQKTTSVDPSQPHVLLAVMAALTQCDFDMARIKQKSLEAKITRMKEDRAKLAHHQRIRDAFNTPR
jgi:hypothetical protein